MSTKDFILSNLEEIAKQCHSPFEFVAALILLKVKAPAEKRRAIEAWNKVHPDKQLPFPISEVRR